MAPCINCKHESHAPGKCSFLFVYDRPASPPGNQRCLCGVTIDVRTSQIAQHTAPIETTDDDKARAAYAVSTLDFMPDPQKQREFLAGEFARCRIAHTVREGLRTMDLDRIRASYSGGPTDVGPLAELGIRPLAMGFAAGLRKFLRLVGRTD